MEVVFSKVAQSTLEEITDYIDTTFSRMVSDVVVRKIVSFTMSLGCTPRLGVRVNELSWLGEVRRAVYRQNKIYYLIDGDTIIVIAVWDGRQSEMRLRQYVNRFLEELLAE